MSQRCAFCDKKAGGCDNSRSFLTGHCKNMIDGFAGTRLHTQGDSGEKVLRGMLRGTQRLRSCRFSHFLHKFLKLSEKQILKNLRNAAKECRNQ